MRIRPLSRRLTARLLAGLLGVVLTGCRGASLDVVSEPPGDPAAPSDRAPPRQRDPAAMPPPDLVSPDPDLATRGAFDLAPADLALSADLLERHDRAAASDDLAALDAALDDAPDEPADAGAVDAETPDALTADAAVLDARPADGRPADAAPGPYPAGPYGGAIGDTVADFVAKGLLLSPDQRDPLQLPYAEVRLRDLRRCRCLLVTVEAMWCGPCKYAQPLLVEAVASDPSLCIAEVLLHGPIKPIYPTAAETTAWASAYHHNFPILAGSDETAMALPNKFYPTTFVIRTDTMKIVDLQIGASEHMVDDALAACPP